MKTFKNLFMLIFVFVFSMSAVNAQWTPVRSNAASDGFVFPTNFCGPGLTGIRLLGTQNAYAASALWNDAPIDLDEGFVASFQIRFTAETNDNDGADGICFVLHDGSIANALGGTGGFLGYDGINAPNSVGVEFDIWQNTDLGDPDPEMDHSVLVANGDLSSPITAPVNIGINGNIEDGNFHTVIARWNPCIPSYVVTVDQAVVVNYQADIRQFFSNGTIVNWGYTAGKAGDESAHDICHRAMQIIPNPIACTEQSDLTACEKEGDFGYILLQCNSNMYQWTLPSGSTATPFNSPGQTVLVNASEGHYEVTITDGSGCTEVREYDIIEDCCKPEPSDCKAPENLYCFKNENGGFLGWNPVPGAISYCIEVNFAGNDECRCEGEGIKIFTSPTNSLPLDEIGRKCFTWRVQAKCCDGKSEWSKEACFDKNTPCLEIIGGDFEGVDNQSGELALESSVFPNPSDGNINVVLDILKATNITIEVVDANGKLIESVKQNYSVAGQYQQKIELENQVVSGIYFVKISDAEGNVNFEKIIVQK